MIRVQSRPWSRITERAAARSVAGATDTRARPVVLAVVGITVAVLIVMSTMGTGVEETRWPTLIALSVLALASELFSYNQTRASSGSIALIPIAALAAIQPTLVAIAAIIVVEIIVQIAHKRPPIRFIFNVAQITLGVSVAIICYQQVGGAAVFSGADPAFLEAARRGIGPVALLTVAITLANTVSMSAVIAASTRVNLFAAWRQVSRASAPGALLMIVLVFYVAWLTSNLGAVGMLGMAAPLLAVRQLYRTSTELATVTEELLDLMVAAIEARDPYTSGHSKRVAKASTIIARAIGLPSDKVERVGVAALLHDVGKIDEAFAPILAKEGRLTPEEWDVMKRHPVRSAQLVEMLSSLKDIVAPVRHHHENWDGTGYPDGIKGESIPLASRIIMFADTLDAITTDRPYRKALGMEEARAEFVRFRARQFDPAICDVVLRPEVWSALYESFGYHSQGIPQPAQRIAS